MKKPLLTLAFLLLALTGYSQNWKPNFDFEVIHNGRPTGWVDFGGANYTLAVDSATVKNGKFAASLEYKEGKPDFKAWAFHIPESYPGKKITLTGYIKTEGVTDGYAGLWMRIDPSIAFDNMQDRGVTGTTDWTRYEISLKMDPEKTQQIVIGGILAGKGKMWVDDLKLTVDGKEIKDLKPLGEKLFPADLDTAFNQGSGIATLTTNQSNVQHLKALGLIWGFLKYHHPAIAAGQYNWDDELFRILPQIVSSPNEQERDKILVAWIKGLGEVEEGKKAKTKTAEAKLVPDLDWIENEGLSAELQHLLWNIKNAKRPEENYYIGLHPGVMNPNFKHENAYAEMIYPDAGFRLLALYRYWNIIQYYFPYKYLIEEDWKAVLEEFIPKVIETQNEAEYTLVMLELIARIHDTHATIWGNNPVLNQYLGTRYTAVELTFVEEKPIVTDFYDEFLGKETGLAIGDVITRINGKGMEELVKEQLKYLPASNYPTQLRDLAKRLLRTNDSRVEVEFVRNEAPGKVTLKTYSTDEINIYKKYQTAVPSFKLIDQNIAYIHNGALKRSELPDIWEKMKGTKGLIIDIRNYPSDFPIYELSKYLMPASQPFFKLTHGSIDQPGRFTFIAPLRVGEKNKASYKGKVVILIDENSQSSAEFHAMAYRTHPNATVIGSTTAGADGNVSSFNLPGGISTSITGLGIYYPDGEETQRVGIVPDIEVKPTIQGIREGRDELMEKAVELINTP